MYLCRSKKLIGTRDIKLNWKTQSSSARFSDTPTILGVLCTAVDCLLIYIKMIINSPGSSGEREKRIPTYV